MTFARALLIATLSGAGCVGQPGDDPVDGGPQAADAGADAGTDPDAATGRVVAGATDAALDLPFTVTIAGDGSSRIGAIEVDAAAGTVEVDGSAHAGFVYQMQPWPEFDYTLFQTLVVAADRWYVVWFYCRDDELTGIYSEGTDGSGLLYESASGACTYSETAQTVAVELPAIDMPWPALVTGFTAEGSDLILADGAPGWLRIGADELTVLAFEVVDCTTACGDPGWWELHALLVDEPGGRVCFGIFYLGLDDPGQVTLAYSITLPDLIDPAGDLVLPATWTAPQAGAAASSSTAAHRRPRGASPGAAVGLFFR